MDNNFIYEIDGQKGQILKLYEDRCVVTAKGGLKSLFSRGKENNEKTYYFRYVTDIKKYSKTSSGKIEFVYNDPAQNPIYDSDNSFEFGAGFTTPLYGVVTDQMDHIFEDIVRHWKSVMGAESVAEIKPVADEPEITVSQPASIADELLKFKQLLDMGAITKEEFEAQKKKLLHS